MKKNAAPQSGNASRLRLSAAALVVSGILFALYPALRPFSDETSLEGAAAFASSAWIVAHMLAMVGFMLLPLGLLGLHGSLQQSPSWGSCCWLSAHMAAVAVWRSGSYPKSSGIPFPVGFGLYIPQFAGTQPIRVAHGMLVAAGCLWIAAGMWRHSEQVGRK